MVCCTSNVHIANKPALRSDTCVVPLFPCSMVCLTCGWTFPPMCQRRMLFTLQLANHCGLFLTKTSMGLHLWQFLQPMASLHCWCICEVLLFSMKPLISYWSVWLHYKYRLQWKEHSIVILNNITTCHVSSLTLFVGTQPDQQFYNTTLFSPASGPFSVGNCSLTLDVLPVNDPPVIDVAHPGTYMHMWVVWWRVGFGCETYILYL